MEDNDDELTLDDLPEIPEDSVCPECGEGPLEPTPQPNRWLCYSCGRVFDGDPPDGLVEIEIQTDRPEDMEE